MAKGGIDKLSEQVAQIIDAELRADFDQKCSRGVSPIEAIVELGLRALCRQEYVSTQYQHWFPELMAGAKLHIYELYVEAQAKVLDWPVDFFVRVVDYDDQLWTAVIECDGHDFHERTKEQAIRDRSRDRRLQEAGHRVFRFTGAEIYRDPMKCASEVYDWAQAIWQSKLPG